MSSSRSFLFVSRISLSNYSISLLLNIIHSALECYLAFLHGGCFPAASNCLLSLRMVPKLVLETFLLHEEVPGGLANESRLNPTNELEFLIRFMTIPTKW